MLRHIIPLRFARTPLKSVICHATGYEGTATCTGKTTERGMGTTGEVTIYLRLTAANRRVPTCTSGHGPSPDPTLFCAS
jgi:cytochrome c oxidase assembly protein Cox11